MAKKKKRKKRKTYKAILGFVFGLSAAALVLLVMLISGKILNKELSSEMTAEATKNSEKIEKFSPGRTAGVFRQEIETAEASSGEDENGTYGLDDEDESLSGTLTDDTEEEVAETETETERVITADTELLFTGDVLLWDGTLAAYENQGIDGLLSPELRERFQNADILMINEEFPFSDRGEQAPDKQFTFRCDPARVSAFQEMGVDIVTLANNHTLDYGQTALLDTLETLEGAGIPYVGAGRNLDEAKKLVTIEKNGHVFGFLGASRVWPVGSWSADVDRPGMFGTYDPAQLLVEIQKAKETCDFLTVFVHWGIERATIPEDYEKVMAKQYMEAGADLVIGSHPHVLQGMEFFGEMPVYYSLGNFIFNTKTYDTAVARVVLKQDGTTEFGILPARSSGSRVSLLTGEEASSLYSYLDTLSFGTALDENGVLRVSNALLE